jgi:hypothetical protein
MGVVSAGLRPVWGAAGQCRSVPLLYFAAVQLRTDRWSRLAARGRWGPGAGPGFAVNEQVRSGGTPAPDEAAEGWCCEHLPTALIPDPDERVETHARPYGV